MRHICDKCLFEYAKPAIHKRLGESWPTCPHCGNPHEEREMSRYKITLNGNTYTHIAEDCEGAMDKFCQRMVFGNPLVCNVHLKMYDADTRGEEWAQYDCDGKTAMVEIKGKTETTNFQEEKLR